MTPEENTLTTLTPLPDRTFGLTIDDASDDDTIVDLLEKIKRATGQAPVVRVVIDADEEGTSVISPAYARLLRRIKEGDLAYVVGEILDSFEVHHCATKDRPPEDSYVVEESYVERTEACLSALGQWVDVWEVGNEMNGEWVGWEEGKWKASSVTAEDMQRMRNSYARAVGKAHELLIRAGKETALTFYFNDDGERHTWFEYPKKKRKGSDEEVSVGEHYSMLKWAEDYRDHFADAKYVFVSYYEDDHFADDPVTGRRTRIIPTPEKWAKIYAKLRGLYPQARFGFGEMGAQCYYLKNDRRPCPPREYDDAFHNLPRKRKCGDRRCECCLEAQREYVTRYYVEWDAAIRRELGRISPSGLDQLYIGGYFYWHFNDDVIDKITASNDSKTSSGEKRKLLREAADTLDTLIAAFRRW